MADQATLHEQLLYRFVPPVSVMAFEMDDPNAKRDMLTFSRARFLGFSDEGGCRFHGIPDGYNNTYRFELTKKQVSDMNIEPVSEVARSTS